MLGFTQPYYHHGLTNYSHSFVVSHLGNANATNYGLALDTNNPLNTIIVTMQNRSENIGVGLGMLLGRYDLKKSIDATSSLFSRFWKSTSSSMHHITTKATKILHRLQNRKKVVEFITTNDPNGAFEQTNLLNQYSKHSIEQQGYSLFQHYIATPERICEILSAEYLGEKFSGLIFSGHGSQHSTSFGYGRLTSSNIRTMLQCVPDHLESNTKIIFSSCSTGDLTNLPLAEQYPLDNNLFTAVENVIDNVINSLWGLGSENIALATYRFLSQTHPAIEISAPSKSVFNFIRSLDPLSVVSVSFYNAKFVNVEVIYNYESVRLIDNGNRLLALKPSKFSELLFVLKPSDTMTKWKAEFNANQVALIAAMRFTPPEQDYTTKWKLGIAYAELIYMKVTYNVQLLAGIGLTVVVTYKAAAEALRRYRPS